MRSSSAAEPRYVSAWLARRGARPVGIDNSEGQLATARELQQRFGLDFPLIHGNAERVPLPRRVLRHRHLRVRGQHLVRSEEWIPEAARRLRPGGELVFLVNSVLGMLCSGELGATQTQLMRPQFGMNRFEWPDDDSVEFHISHGAMIALLRESGFDVEQLIEVRPPADAESGYDLVELNGPGAGLARRSGGRASADARQTLVATVIGSFGPRSTC